MPTSTGKSFMKPLDDPEVREWLLKVTEDCRAAEVLSASAEPLDDAICFIVSKQLRSC
jgi:hypothetical protein